MSMSWRIAGVAMVGAAAAALLAAAGPKPVGPARYTADGKMEFPADYRTWVFLSAGMDMAYGENAAAAAASAVHLFDNVFVDRPSYAVFEKTGRWPEGATFVLEIRRAVAEGSINKRGHFQTDRAAVEVHVKDKRFPGGWAFFNFRGQDPGQKIAEGSQCHTCHQAHGATDTTFVQFYPTLLPIAREKKTLTEAYLASEAKNVAVK
jgi:hypothetical protein